ncbi:hexitol phosphatase HxpB [Vibrio rumoiensis]|uniref:2-deoxyglucose-6-phosphatase n=1 Tax=Vibrio rumoiensis 1S-45 TaxID=1188252 RepID=A0A1E5E773_9VIBR|nr:hexitol phosphatase HxpB [Vibrio rumoiensis]OEF30159.1 2-deoxyglucose-6-phosphatase [Vibrio rumoiensis 1S-45]
MIKAAVFDMDGLMVDSEPFWQQAQLEVFPKVGVKLTLQDTIDTTGVRIDQIVELYYRQSPWSGLSCEDVCNMILTRVIELVKEHKPMMPGLFHALETCQQQDLKIALASSSPMVLIEAVLEALELDGVFEAVLSAEGLPYGKPHPEVYLNAADALEVSPLDCVALEDSFTGLLAAKAAQMKTIVIPEHSQREQPRFVIADHKLTSLEQITPELLQSL